MDESIKIKRLMSHLKQNLPAIYDNWIQTHIAHIDNKNNIKGSRTDTLPYTFVLSVSDGHKKAKTVTFIINDLIQADKTDSANRFADFEKILPIIHAKIDKLSSKFDAPIVWLRLEWLHQATLTTWADLQQDLKRFKRNYYRSGIAFEGMREPWLLLTETELNANACLYAGNTVAHAQVNTTNLDVYFKARHGSSQLPNFREDLVVISFNTAGVFIDGDTGDCHNLDTQPRFKGHRKLLPLSAATTQPIIEHSTQYLARQVQPSGQYVYGYFPCFDRKINTYNSLRHASSTYALIEGYEACRGFHDFSSLDSSDSVNIAAPAKLGLTEMQNNIDGAMSYLAHQLIHTYDDKAYVIDTGGEIKLGANAVAILALVKYLQVFADTPLANEYRDLANKLALGITEMQQEDGSFVHVLHKDLTLKAKHRIIYYDGEAAFALMRLYGLTKDERWLNCVTRAFDYFIEANHHRAHDHWLSYCSNELVIYKPEKKYFQFAVNNIAGYTDFIKNRITTFPTLLELSMAFHKMLLKLDEHPAFHDVLVGFDTQHFYQALHARANHLMNGFFFPEMAMFYKAPQTILHGFFIRHHSFRVRIDDVEHYLSGLIAYYELLNSNIYPKLNLKAEKRVELEIKPVVQAGTNISTIAWGGDVNLGRRQHYLTKLYGLENVLNIAALRKADFTIVNLECVVSILGEQGRIKGEGGPYYYRALPKMVEILRHAGVNAVACANNHSGDYGTNALMQQKEILQAAGIISVGTGDTKEKAFAPIFHQLPNGIKIALFNVDSTMEYFAATNKIAGAAYLDPQSHQLWTETYTSLFKSAKEAADLIIVAVHWGDNGRATPDSNEIEIGHRLIDAGADAVLGASAHQLQGIEVYKSKPIIHDAGDLLFDAAVSKASPKAGGVFHLEIGLRGVERVNFYSTYVKYGQTQTVTGEQAIALSRDFASKCIAMGTTPSLYEDGHLSIAIEPRLPRQISNDRKVYPNPVLDNQKNDVDYSKWSAKTRNDLIIDEVPEDARIEPIGFGVMQLVGIRTHPYFFNRRRMLWIESFWQITEAVADDIRIHFRAKPIFQTNKMRPWGIGTDHDPCDWLIPTSHWETGKVYRDFYGLRPPYKNTWEDGNLQLEVSIIDKYKRHSFVELPFKYVLHTHKVRYADNLAEHMHYRQAFLDKVYENHTKGTWNAEQIASITRGKWLVAPPEGWYVDSLVAGKKHVSLAAGRVMFVGNTNDNRAAHENSTKKPKPFDRHQDILGLQNELVGAIVDHPIKRLKKDFPILQVADPIKAWMELGIAARSRFSNPVIAITGTVGKSSTCEMLGQMMVDSKVLTSLDNYNSRVGAIGSLASLSPHHDAAIIEVAQSALWMKRGPITQFIRPDVALVTEIGYSQTQQVKSLEHTMKYKTQIFNGLSRNAIAVVGAHLPLFEQVLYYAQKYSKRVVIYGEHPQAQIRVKSIELSLESSHVKLETDEGDFEFNLPIPSIGMAKNAIAAFAVIYAIGFNKKAACYAMEHYKTTERRLQIEKFQYAQGVINIIDDSFNAEYDSMVNAFTIFKESSFKNAHDKSTDIQGSAISRYNKKIFVLGRIVHLGDKSQDIHEALAQPVLQSDPDLVLTHGEEMKWLRAKLPDTILGPHFNNAEALAKFLKQKVSPDDVILFKGSSRDSDFGKTGVIFKSIL